MNRSQFNKAIVPGLFALSRQSYRSRAKQAMWKKLVTMRPSSRAYEEVAYFGGLGLPAKKPEGQAITYDDFVQGSTKRWTHTTYGLGTTVTEEMIEDTLYDSIPTEMRSQMREMSDSFNELWEILVHDLINNGTATTNHTDADGNALFISTHPRLRGGTWTNILSPASDLSATSLQTAIQQFETQKSDENRFQIIRPREIWIAPAQEWKTRELLESQFDPESANNSVNTIRSRSLRPMVSPYLTDTDAFTLKAEPPNETVGIIAFMRRRFRTQQDGDFDTGDMKFKGTARFSAEAGSARNLFHSAGA